METIDHCLWLAVEEHLKKMEETSYDAQTGLLQEYVTGKNYHTAVTAGVVHRTRENLNWLPALLRRGREGDRAIAQHTVLQILDLQDQDPASPTFGIWPYLFEEPLKEMQNPDWNWAAFMGSILFTLLEEFGHEFTEALVKDMKKSLTFACESILRRRMGVDYTNISLMSASVLVLSGELLGEERLIQKGIKILECQLDFVTRNGGFAEYNSPTYGVIDIEETGRLLRYTRSKKAKSLAKALHFWSWKVFADHYHPSTGQIAPPHTRCYEDIQSGVIRTLITLGTQGTWKLEPEDRWQVNLLWPFMTLACPKELWESFGPRVEPDEIREDFYRGYDPISNDEIRVLIEKGTPALTSCTYLHPQFALGSFARHDMWNQRRPLMAYLSTNGETVCFRARCLHDGMDFSGAVMANIQKENAAAGGISFVTDHGDYHYILTPLRDGTMEAGELSVEFLMTGDVEGTKVEKVSENDWIFRVGTCTIYLRIMEAAFDGALAEAEPVDTDGCKGVRLVLYRPEDGKKRGIIDFNAILNAYVLYWLEITTYGCAPVSSGAVRHGCGQNSVVLCRPDGFCDEVIIPEKPGLYMPALSGMKKILKNGGFYYHEEGPFKNIL